MEARWGLELWDCVDQVLAEVAANNTFLSSTCSKYIRERGEVEREYARNLRRLSEKYSASCVTRGSGDEGGEQRQTVQCFKSIMVELGYQAGQHELLADEFTKKYPVEIKHTIKDVLKMVENVKKELKCHQTNLEKSYKCLDKVKSKYVKGQEGFNSTEDLLKIKKDTPYKEQQVEELKIEYAVQLVQTNKCQSEYYDCNLPSAIESIQKICEGQCLYFASVLTRCIENEKNVLPIIDKCHRDMETTLKEFDIKKEMNMVIERNKTGSVPPSEIQFDDLSTPGLLSGILASSEPLLLKAETESGKSLYQEKRQIEKKIKAQEEQIQKGIKEILALQKMIKTYKANPKFGSPDKLCEQQEMSIQRVEILKSGVMLMRGELERVLSKLEIIKMSNETYYYSNYGSLPGNRTPDPTEIYFTPDVSSNDLNKEYESIEMIMTSNKKNNFYGYEDDDTDNIYEKSLCFSGEHKSLEELDTYKSKVYDWVTHCTNSPSPPPPPLPSQPPMEHLTRVVALYPFIGEVENSINMEEGEHFFVTEQDVDGWTRVRRVNIQQDSHDKPEGFVPSSFIKFTL